MTNLTKKFNLTDLQNEVSADFITLIKETYDYMAWEFAVESKKEWNDENQEFEDTEIFVGFNHNYIYDSVKKNEDTQKILDLIEFEENDLSLVLETIANEYLCILEEETKDYFLRDIESEIEKELDEYCSVFFDSIKEELEEREKEFPNVEEWGYTFDPQGTEVYNRDSIKEIVEKYTNLINVSDVSEYLESKAFEFASEYAWGVISSCFNDLGYKLNNYETSQNYNQPVYTKQNDDFEG